MRKRFGDRRDAVRIRDIDGIHFYMAYSMARRTEAEVYINETVDVTELLKFIEEKNTDGNRKVTLFHCMLSAVARTVKMRPLLNRYISGKHFYMRDKITLGFVIKRKFSDHAEETLMMYTPKDEGCVTDITDDISAKVNATRSGKASDNPDGILNIVKKFPKPVMYAFMGFIHFADTHGLMPKSFTDVDTDYCTVLLSNLGSIKCDAVYHHLNNTGTNGIVITIGEIHKEMIADENGVFAPRDVISIGVTLDERIADGFYFARSLKLIKHLFKNPKLLEIPLGEAIEFEF